MSETASEEIAVRTLSVVQPATGEMFDLTKPEEAARAVHEFKALEEQLADARRAAEYALVLDSQEQGAKTLRYGNLTAEISGGPGATGIDPVKLRDGLAAAGCPSDRIEEAIKTEVTEKANRSVCRQLAGANPAYKQAIDAATYTFEKRYSVKVG